MSVLGTQTAAGVAQTALQAQQTARQRDRASSQTTADARSVREKVETFLHTVEEGDQANAPGQVRVDDQLPQHQSPDPHRRKPRRPPQDTAPDSPDQTQDAQPHADGQAPVLYHHVDLQA